MPKKIIINNTGGTEVLQFVDFDLPKNIDDGCVRLKNLSIGVNYIDTYHRSGVYPLDLPSGLGLEGVAEVIDLGPNVLGFSVGERVGYAFTPLGAYSDFRDFPAKRLFKIPEFISNNDAASVLLKGATVEYLFNRTYKIKKDDVVLFHAAAGGVGLLACQWARSIGCKIIGTVGSDKKAEIALKNGCSHVINYKNQNVVKEIMEITEDRGVSVVYDGVGRDTFEDSLSCLSRRGLFVSFGQSSGMIDSVNLHKSFNPKSLFFTRPTLLHYTDNKVEMDNSYNLLFNKIKKKEIKINLDGVYHLGDVSDVHKKLESRKTSGSIVLVP
mgnify:CR=1 FL=1